MCYRGVLVVGISLVVGAGCVSPVTRHAREERLFEGAFRGGSDPERRKKRSFRHPPSGKTCKEVLAEANKSFTYMGKPIHPALLREFQCWISDQNPVTYLVDVSAAYDTNEYCQEVKRGKRGIVCEEDDDGLRGPHSPCFAYRHLGRLADGTHVLRTAEWGSGTMVADYLVFVRFELGRGCYQDGHPYDQLLMRLTRDFFLGDRFKGKVELRRDRAVITFPSGGVVKLTPTGNL
jgi:hypothetical protein